MRKFIQNMLARRKVQKDLGVSRTKYLHISVDLLVIPKYKIDIREGADGKPEVVKTQDGFQCVATPKDQHVTYRRLQPKRKSARRQRIEERDARNNWGAEKYIAQRAQAERTRAQQAAAAEWRQLAKMSDPSFTGADNGLG